MLTLLRQASPLADPAQQRALLDSACGVALPHFEAALAEQGRFPLHAAGIDVLQVNVGKVCNQTCAHCHVDAGPERRESMSRQTAAQCLAVLRDAGIGTLDITGGAPELNPNFRWLVEEASNLGCRVIDRCNLTILTAPGYDDLPEFLARHEVEIVASLPCYLEENTDRQRGAGVFARSIAALKRLNELGYGHPSTALSLTLVYNPLGAALPPPQAELEAAYRRELQARYGVSFTRLYTITNMPISRFLADLLASGRCDTYMQKLVAAFNPATVDGLMCRSTLSVDWRGNLFDCDFNQMLDLPVHHEAPQHITEFSIAGLQQRRIATGRHCFGCTAGAGSSCQGAVVS
jgi:radical SAM/Cys-rich protein